MTDVVTKLYEKRAAVVTKGRRHDHGQIYNDTKNSLVIYFMKFAEKKTL